MLCSRNLLSKVVIMVAVSIFIINIQAFAQNSEQNYDLQQKEQQQSNFSDTELEKFASAYKQVNGLQKEYSAKLRKTQQEEEARALQEKYIQKMKGVINGENLSIRKYNNIINAMNTNEQLARKVQNMAQ